MAPGMTQAPGMPKGMTLTGYTPSTICSATTPDAELPALGGETTTAFGAQPLPVYEAPVEPNARVSSFEQYQQLYAKSIANPGAFWLERGRNLLEWFKRPTEGVSFNYDTKFGQSPHVSWLADGKLNACDNCVDRHVMNGRGNQNAIIWEGNEPGEVRKITFRELSTEVQRFANVLKSKGVKKGDVVTVYMPMIPELAITLLACARIGAVHSVVFGGFSPDALAQRINDAQSSILITADGTFRGKKPVDLKSNADAAMAKCDGLVESCIVYNRTNGKIDTDMQQGRDKWWNDEVAQVSDRCAQAEMNAEDPLFVLYTSGSTGKPKGQIHSTGGYLTYAASTTLDTFDLDPDRDVHFCTADIGWVTGHSYIVYGPLSQGVTTVMFEGIPSYPDMGRFWQICQDHGVATFYTAPTAIRALQKDGGELPKDYDLSKLRVLGTVGEPINPEAWEWYRATVGAGTAPITDTWWQTETGGHMLTSMPFATSMIPGVATLPYFGIKPELVDEKGDIIIGPGEGRLVITHTWPGQARGMQGMHTDPKVLERYKDTYYAFENEDGETVRIPYYVTGDGAIRDEHGNIKITGRVDDVINVSGHRFGTAELESALAKHKAIAEAAVVGFPHEKKGSGIYAYVVLNPGYEMSDDLRKILAAHMRKEIGPIATPDIIQEAGGLPKTRSGKNMRRILKQVAAGLHDEIGDTSTLADPEVVDGLISGHRAMSKRDG